MGGGIFIALWFRANATPPAAPTSTGSGGNPWAEWHRQREQEADDLALILALLD